MTLPDANSNVTANAGDFERPGEDDGLFRGICGAPAARGAAAFGIVGRNGILKSTRAFT